MHGRGDNEWHVLLFINEVVLDDPFVAASMPKNHAPRCHTSRDMLDMCSEVLLVSTQLSRMSRVFGLSFRLDPDELDLWGHYQSK